MPTPDDANHVMLWRDRGIFLIGRFSRAMTMGAGESRSSGTHMRAGYAAAVP
jgi:hypothetical protein